jgi:iron complex outermembrane receptor protein
MIMTVRATLLMTAAILSFATPAFAADDVAAAPVGTPAAAGDDAGAGDDEIVVFGTGQTRQVQEVSQQDLRVQVPGTSPLKAIAKLPGVNFQSADAFGNYEWSQRVSIRGFNQNQLGFTLDGVPLGDFSYGNVNGLHISRAISSENIARTEVSQGAGSISTASTNNLGGTLEFVSRDPSSEFALDVEGTYGDNDTIRGFARVDSGDLGGGVRGYLSYGYLNMDKWKGVGEQKQHVVNAKAVVPVGSATLTGSFDFSDRRETDYQDLSLDMIKRLGLRNDNIGDNFALALRIAQVGANRGDTGAVKTNPLAGTVYPAPYGTVDDVYYDAAGLRQDYLGSVRLDAPLAEGLTGHLTGYYHSNHGMGLWWTPYVPSPNGSQISQRTTEYDIRRGGAFGSVDYEKGDNKLTVGGWWETNDFHQARRFYSVDPATVDASDHLKFPKNPFATQWEFKFKTDTLQYFVEDRIAFGDLTLSAGAKGFKVKIDANPIVTGGLAQGKIASTDWFQPSVGAVYKIGFGELFADFTQATRAFTGASTGGPFATTQAGFDALKVKPESSDTYEAGLRFREGALSGVLAGYYVEFSNRLLSFTNGAGIVGNPAILQNVGGVESYGIEAAAQYKIMNAVTLFASYSYNHSTYEDNVFNANGTIRSAIKGKTVVDAPEHMLRGEIAYDDGTFSARIGADYMSKRYFTYTNDQSVPDRVLVDASIGYTFHGGAIEGLEVRASASNLFDKKYVSTIGSNGFGDSGDNQTLLAGSPQQFFVTVRKSF